MSCHSCFTLTLNLSKEAINVTSTLRYYYFCSISIYKRSTSSSTKFRVIPTNFQPITMSHPLSTIATFNIMMAKWLTSLPMWLLRDMRDTWTVVFHCLVTMGTICKAFFLPNILINSPEKFSNLYDTMLVLHLSITKS